MQFDSKGALGTYTFLQARLIEKLTLLLLLQTKSEGEPQNLCGEDAFAIK